VVELEGARPKALLLRRWESDGDAEVENSANLMRVVCEARRIDMVELGRRTDENVPAQFHDALFECDFVVGILTNATRTLHFELGFARALGKRILLIQPERSQADDESHIYLAQENILRYKLGNFNDLDRRLRLVWMPSKPSHSPDATQLVD
jgi:hypothetical protein